MARIHDPARVSALFLGAIEAQLTPALIDDPALGPALGATGVSTETEGRGLELAARIELTRPGALSAAALRLGRDQKRGAVSLAALRALLNVTDPVPQMVAARLNREVAFARGFAAADGFEFPVTPDDIAADLMLQLREIRTETRMRTELTYHAAFAPLGVAAIDRIAAARRDPAAQRLDALMARIESEVLEQLAAETGRAAARRLKGTAL